MSSSTEIVEVARILSLTVLACNEPAVADDVAAQLASKVLLIHTGLQPGGKALTLLRNGFLANACRLAPG